MRVKLITINSFSSLGGAVLSLLSYPCSTLSCPFSGFFHTVTTSACSPCPGDTTPQGSKATPLLSAGTRHHTWAVTSPRLEKGRAAQRQKDVYRVAGASRSSCSLVSGEILADESHSLLCTVIFYTNHAQTREQKRCVCSSSVRNTKTLFWWTICLLRKAQLNCRSSKKKLL